MKILIKTFLSFKNQPLDLENTYNYNFERSLNDNKNFSLKTKLVIMHSEKRFDWIKENDCLNDFLWFKEMIRLNEVKFVWFKQNIFEPNKYLFKLNQINISSKQRN